MRRTDHPGAHIGDAGHLQGALQRAVLAIRPVEDRNHNVERLRADAARRRPTEADEAAAAARQEHDVRSR